MSNQIMKLKIPGDIGNDFRDLINAYNAKREYRFTKSST